MNRRDALKNLTLSLGYTVAAPTIISLMTSCTAEADGWTPLFLSEAENHMVTHLVDIIVPTTDTPGALEVNVPQFLDLMYHDIELKPNQKAFKAGAQIFSNEFLKSNNKTILKGEKEDFEIMVSRYFDVADEASKKIFKHQNDDIINIHGEKLETYNLYKFLLSVRYYTIFGYCTSENVGENILAYDPIPGVYSGCMSLEEATNGKVWSLK